MEIKNDIKRKTFAPLDISKINPNDEIIIALSRSFVDSNNFILQSLSMEKTGEVIQFSNLVKSSEIDSLPKDFVVLKTCKMSEVVSFDFQVGLDMQAEIRANTMNTYVYSQKAADSQGYNIANEKNGESFIFTVSFNSDLSDTEIPEYYKWPDAVIVKVIKPKDINVTLKTDKGINKSINKSINEEFIPNMRGKNLKDIIHSFRAKCVEPDSQVSTYIKIKK